jgi:glycosyltransferase involved in cell wall biosynthesis
MTTEALDIGMFADFFALMRGGGETYAAHLALQLQRMGHGVTIVAAKSLSRPCHPITDELPIRYVPSLFELRELSRTLPWKLEPLVYAVQDEFYRLMVRKHFAGWDIIHAHTVGVARSAAQHRSQGQAVVLTLHGRPSRRFRRSLAAVDCLVSYSLDVCSYLPTELGLECQFIPPGVDQEVFRPVDKGIARSRVGLDGDPLILFVGRLIPVKNIPVLLRGFQLARAQLPQARLALVGHGVLKERLQRMSMQLGIADAVTLADVVPQRELRYFYAAADAFVLPSAYESLALVCLEAMMCGCPVIVSDKVEGIIWLFPETRTFRHESPTELALQIVESYRGGNVLVGAEQLESFRLDRMGRAYSDLYAELLAVRRGASGRRSLAQP